MSQTKLKRDDPGYLVIFEGVKIGRVWKRDGGWWSWQSFTTDGGSSWCYTRKEGVERVVAFHSER
jgi:hypothetical protein